MLWFGPSCRVLRFFKLMYLYIEVPKTIANTFSHILNLIFIKERVLFVLGLGLWFLSKINIFVANLHLTYQFARLWHPPSLSYSTFFSDLFVSCLLRIQIQNDHTLSWIGWIIWYLKQGSGLNFLFYVIFLSYKKNYNFSMSVCSVFFALF